MVQDAFILKGRTVAITRPCDQAEETGKIIEKKGGKPYFIPAIEIKRSSDPSSIKKFVNQLMKGEIDYVIFMSINGVRYLLSAAESLGLLHQLKEFLEKTVTVAVGPRTAQELKTNQIHVSLIPAKYSSEGILQSLQQLDISGKVICIPRTSGANPILAERLRERGGKVQEIHVYESIMPISQNLTERFFQDLTSGKIHAIIFSSSLCVKNLFRMLEKHISMEKLRDALNSNLNIVAIGPATADTLREMGLKVDVMPDKHVFEEALTALARYWNTH
jgi:uroporphyrinogen-III synthase